jgi:hypothetical protein
MDFRMTTYNFRNQLFYTLKPLIPRSAQIFLRRQIARQKRRKNGYQWPIDPNAARPPEGWPGWPDGKQFTLVLSHDVDTRKGYDNVLKLADIEEQMGFRSQFNFVPERYGVVEVGLLDELKRRGFGIGVHGLKHDGKLFSSKKTFDERAPRINAYLKKWGTRGFTTPSMIRNHDWMHALDIDYCVSTFDTDPFEPQQDAAGTIFPFVVRRKPDAPASSPPGLPASEPPSFVSSPPPSFFVELPYTLPQDSTLFIILQEQTIAIWTKKLDWVAEKGGMVLLNSHPDYMAFHNRTCAPEEYPVRLYREFLEYAKTRYQDRCWAVLPSQVNEFYRSSLPLNGYSSEDVPQYLRQPQAR